MDNWICLQHGRGNDSDLLALLTRKQGFRWKVKVRLILSPVACLWILFADLLDSLYTQGRLQCTSWLPNSTDLYWGFLFGFLWFQIRDDFPFPSLPLLHRLLHQCSNGIEENYFANDDDFDLMITISLCLLSEIFADDDDNDTNGGWYWWQWPLNARQRQGSAGIALKSQSAALVEPMNTSRRSIIIIVIIAIVIIIIIVIIILVEPLNTSQRSQSSSSQTNTHNLEGGVQNKRTF